MATTDACRESKVPAIGPRRDAREARIAIAVIAMTAATARMVRCSPIAGISTNPASSAPRIAPSVLIA